MSRIFDFVRTLTARTGAGGPDHRLSDTDQPVTETQPTDTPTAPLQGATTLAGSKRGADIDDVTTIENIAPPSPAGPTPIPYPNEPTSPDNGDELLDRPVSTVSDLTNEPNPVAVDEPDTNQQLEAETNATVDEFWEDDLQIEGHADDVKPPPPPPPPPEATIDETSSVPTPYPNSGMAETTDRSARTITDVDDVETNEPNPVVVDEPDTAFGSGDDALFEQTSEGTYEGFLAEGIESNEDFTIRDTSSEQTSEGTYGILNEPDPVVVDEVDISFGNGDVDVADPVSETETSFDPSQVEGA